MSERRTSGEAPLRFLSPEQRRREARRGRLRRRLGPGSRTFEVLQRVIVGTWNDGSIHAGNLAYMTVLAIFPFFILGAALFSALGEEAERAAAIDALVRAVPPVVAQVIEPVARSVIEARSGWLLWAGGAVGLWTVGSLIEAIRELLRRAYGTVPARAAWLDRLATSGIVIGAVVLLMVTLIVQVLIGTAQQLIYAYLPWLDTALAQLSFSRLITAAALFGTLWVLFYSLTPMAYRARRYPKWPGALVTAGWWVIVTLALPPVMRTFFSYDLTYGALSGVMIALFFFWLVGLGMVVGAELNAALAVTPEEEAAQAREAKEDAA
ncbi:MAG: YihY/virulence factor BrkB family protein [Sphingomonadaceae bacterium]